MSDNRFPIPEAYDAASLFPPLNFDTSTHPPESYDASDLGYLATQQKDTADGLLWHDVNTLSIPDDNSLDQGSQNMCSESYRELPPNAPVYTTPSSSTAHDEGTNPTEPSSSHSSVFNISWGGNDKPPTELHPDEPSDRPIRNRPLPKPRGIRKLPEPEPAEDGTVDEDTLKRRKNTHAARRSRLKKLLKIEHLENRVDELQAENAKLVLSNALLESDKRTLRAKEVEYKKRIKYLEEQLGNHRTMSSSSPLSSDTSQTQPHSTTWETGEDFAIM
ncbi:uncharacterized protein BYT42DRAFT_613151 [Radiomyces spectabilis]|uniref:uncharacterized protein n=1 Tax=Radiomyces spectabilis TaxID=64574 RepID=UPI0022205287|nr:uncharacterized protein BYT42DRAFT_613151 [Radiomyces spectabilis]KAI8381367.1 hypothetical protein BYT42DRAFT_613151 [Radiomyces spectabilis]